jgi:two-component sensor histidine kinase
MDNLVIFAPGGGRRAIPSDFADSFRSGTVRGREDAPRLLIVDDEVVILSHLEEMLESCGYEVAGKAATAESALEKARGLRPDLVIMDIVMPGDSDGIDACEKIQGELGIPVVLLTAYGNKSYISRAKVVSPYGYILKPYQNEQVLAAVELALEKKELDSRLENAFKDTNSKAENRGMQLKEIHHRVKNHLSMISSFLALKSLEITDQDCADAMDEIKARVNTVASIHEQLYRSEDLENIDCREYIRGLIDSFDTSIVNNENVRIETDIERHQCPSDKVMLLGLIVSELVSNSLKYAFEPGKEGVIRVALHSTADGVELVVSDNGRGLPDDVNPEAPDTFGLGLVQALARQLKTELDFETGAGATYRFRFGI